MSDVHYQWSLVGTSGFLKDREYILVGDQIELGRTTGNDIIIPENKISRKHASLFLNNKTWWIQDHKSKNGVFLNKKRIEVSTLQKGDMVQIGDCSFRVHQKPQRTSFPSGDRARALSKILASISQVGMKRIFLYAIAVLILGYLFWSYFQKATVPNSIVKSNQSIIFSESPKLDLLNVQDEEVLKWKIQADAALQFNDLAQAYKQLRKVISARPHDERSQRKLTRVKTRLKNLISRYDENGAREYEKLYYDRAIREWRKVLALSHDIDNNLYKKTKERVREAELKLVQRPQ